MHFQTIFLEFVAYYFFGSFATVIINKNLSESFLLKMTSKSLLNYGNLIKQEQYYLDFRMRLGQLFYSPVYFPFCKVKNMKRNNK